MLHIERQALDESFGLVLSEHTRAVLVDENGCAHAAGLQPLDRIVSVDGEQVSADSIGAQVAGKLLLEVVVERTPAAELCALAAAEEVREWVSWEQCVVACHVGHVDDLVAALHDLSVLGVRVLERHVSAREARALEAAHPGVRVAAGATIDEVAAAGAAPGAVLDVLADIFEGLEVGAEGDDEEDEMDEVDAAAAADGVEPLSIQLTEEAAEAAPMAMLRQRGVIRQLVSESGSSLESPDTAEARSPGRWTVLSEPRLSSGSEATGSGRDSGRRSSCTPSEA